MTTEHIIGYLGIDDCTPFTEEGLKEVELCKKWILENGQPVSNWNYSRTSYCFKHEVEEWAKSYISNGSFIRAAAELGYEIKQCPGKGNPNAFFKLSSV